MVENGLAVASVSSSLTAAAFTDLFAGEAMTMASRIVVMKDGVVQQIGKPQEVYDNPANLFVANFLGTPPINIFTGHVKGEHLFIGADNVMDVPGVKDQDVFVGIRPEGFILDMEFGTLCCKPQNVEVMGPLATPPESKAMAVYTGGTKRDSDRDKK